MTSPSQRQKSAFELASNTALGCKANAGLVAVGSGLELLAHDGIYKGAPGLTLFDASSV